MNKKLVAVILCVAMVLPLVACKKTKSEEVKIVESLISEIGSVNSDSEGKIVAAESAYSALSPEDKNNVENYDVLLNARKDCDLILKSVKITNVPDHIKVGEMVDLSYEPTPIKATVYEVLWTSSDDSVASVENGQLFAKKPGKCTISVQVNQSILDRVFVCVEGGNNISTISCEAGIGYGGAYGVKADGTVLFDDYSNNRRALREVAEWKDIVSVAAGNYFIMGLKSNGTVVITSQLKDGTEFRYDLSDWKDIVAIAAGFDHFVGLKSDGTVVAFGTADEGFSTVINSNQGQCDVSKWTNIVAIAAGSTYTLGLKSDGTVVATGDNINGACDVSQWTDIVAIAAGPVGSAGVKSDGTVVITTPHRFGDDFRTIMRTIYSWNDIVQVSVGAEYYIGLKSDGTVVAVGENDEGQCDVYDWNDIIAVYTGYDFTIGLKSDGTVVCTGYTSYKSPVKTWTGIRTY